MASRSFLLLALAFAVVLLIVSEVAAAKELASNDNSEINDSGRGGYNNGGGRGGYNNGGGRGGHDNGGGRGGYNNGGGRGGHDNGGGRGYNKGCRYGCCGGGRYNNKGGCKCCSTFEEATAYKQTQN
ncbi:hypothetical protein L2E82_25477 [Cichorium intybus]|uniref:Uncharacterized protein n=1 Tax=Cichorium intybus TaxID=13427 RepID=A0ACB9E413_CICIN|nr:hypothetical protein L2E82_25477 [Cichorium intybus]